MNKRFFLALAMAGVLGFAFASSARAGTVTVDAGFLVVGGTATDMEITFALGAGDSITSVVTPVSNANLGPIAYTVNGPNEVTLVFGASAGTIPAFPALPVEFTFTTNSATVGVLAVAVTGSTGSGAFGGATATLQSVPEPASLALLGIGMTGFLAFRRFFKKTSVA